MSLLVNRMNKRITIQKQVNGKDEEGLPTKKWIDLFSCWAERKGLRGRERFEAASVQMERTTKWRIRYREGITTGMRIVYKDKPYDITFVDDVEGDRRELEIHAEEVSSGG